MNTKKLIMSIVSCLLLLNLSSCQNSMQGSSNQQTDTVAMAVKDRLQTAVATESFPQNVEILLPTQYRKESHGYPKNVKDKDWYEIYKDEKSGEWIIGKTELKVTYGRDECVGENVMIIKSENENAVVFFTPFEGLSENLVTVLEDKILFPEHDVFFRLDGIEYNLSAVGSCLDDNGHIMTTSELKSKTNEELDANIRISGYRLSLGNDGNSIELATIENIEFATPRLIWAGDLNNDGLLDLILNLPDFYESQHVFIFLSDKNDQERPLKKVASLKIVNDC